MPRKIRFIYIYLSASGKDNSVYFQNSFWGISYLAYIFFNMLTCGKGTTFASLKKSVTISNVKIVLATYLPKMRRTF